MPVTVFTFRPVVKDAWMIWLRLGGGGMLHSQLQMPCEPFCSSCAPRGCGAAPFHEVLTTEAIGFDNRYHDREP